MKKLFIALATVFSVSGAYAGQCADSCLIGDAVKAGVETTVYLVDTGAGIAVSVVQGGVEVGKAVYATAADAAGDLWALGQKVGDFVLVHAGAALECTANTIKAVLEAIFGPGCDDCTPIPTPEPPQAP